MNRMNKLNRFTCFEGLKKALKEGLPFSNACHWDDQNDVKLVELYREITHHPNAGILCFVNDDETIYHWSYFSYGNGKEVCCIELDKARLLQPLLYNEKYLCQEVQYDVLKEVCFDTPEELLFTKRHPYRFEREYRIVSLEGGRLPIKDCINKITLSPWLHKDEFEQRKKELLVDFNLECEINHSTLLKNPEWIGKAALLREKTNLSDVCVKHFCYLDQSEKDKIECLINNGYYKLLDCKYNTEVSMVFKAGTLVAVGFLYPQVWDELQNSSDAKTRHYFSPFNCTIKCTEDCDCELEWVVDDRHSADVELHRLVVQSLLASHSKQKIFSVQSEDDNVKREVLARSGFRLLHSKETRFNDYIHNKFVFVRELMS